MANIEFSPESFYILEPNGSYETLGNITKFEEIATYITLFGFRDAILKCCLNKRVVHLALHASKARTRKKNFNRAIRILERF